MSRTRWIASFGALALLLSGGLVIAPTSAASETVSLWVQDGRLAEVDKPTGYIVLGYGIPRRSSKRYLNQLDNRSRLLP